MTAAESGLAPARLEWRVATVISIRDETPHAKTLVLQIPGWLGHRAGQHVDIRLVAEDGYEAQRSYSIASAPESSTVELTIERIDNAEVSPYLCGVLHVGDGVEVRGPIGGYFVWSAREAGPVLLVAGGSGIVPLMSMLRHRARADAATRANAPMRLLYSARTMDDVIYRGELDQIAADENVKVTVTLTRGTPEGWQGSRGRIDRTMLDRFAWPPGEKARAFVCGPTPLVESVATTLVEMGYEPAMVKTERFGPTG